MKSELKGHVGAVYTVKFSASGSFDRTVRIWDASTQKEVLVLDLE
jgi:COMPASS component SWD3